MALDLKNPPINVSFPFALKLGFVSRLKSGLQGRVVKCRHSFPGDMRADVSADPKSLAVLFLQLQDICRIPNAANVVLQLQGVLANGATWFVSFRLCQLREEDWFNLYHFVIQSLSQPLLSACWVVDTIIIADCTLDKFLPFVCI